MDDIQAIINKLPANAKAKAAIKWNGNYTSVSYHAKLPVAVTATIIDIFGSGYLSPSTGVLLNNDMDCFSFDNRFPFNKVEARKRTLSPGCPTVVVDRNGDFKLVTGAASGKRIPPGVGLVSDTKGVGVHES